MDNMTAPYHAHIYYVSNIRDRALSLHTRLSEQLNSGKVPLLLFVGSLRDEKIGPHPIPQFEVHFTKEYLPSMLTLIKESDLTALVHPLTDDDLADHTTLAHWIGEPLQLDLSTLDPPGINQGIARFSKSDF
ncbi:MAG: aromatic ring-cleaving dioxygenase [Oceanicoccus sp.]|jgi:aromatic ring-cleaving dioxygenase